MVSITGLFLLLATLSFDSKSHDFGVAKEGTILYKKFIIKNKGKKSVHILSVSSSCSCTIPSYSNEIKANKTGVINIQFNTKGLSGTVERKLVIVTDDKEQEYYSLTIKAFIK